MGALVIFAAQIPRLTLQKLSRADSRHYHRGLMHAP
jgi:hypothetical protein